MLYSLTFDLSAPLFLQTFCVQRLSSYQICIKQNEKAWEGESGRWLEYVDFAKFIVSFSQETNVCFSDFRTKNFRARKTFTFLSEVVCIDKTDLKAIHHYKLP